jgi:hypothetical protein
METVIRINDNEVTVNGRVYKAVNKPEQIYLCGLWWDTENLTDEYCNFHEANGRAVLAGKRLPTKEEFQKLNKLPRMSDEEKGGVWFAEDENDLKNPDKSLFLPAGRSTMIGHYWSSTPYNENEERGWYLFFGGYNMYVCTNYDWNTNRFKVRCVNK